MVRYKANISMYTVNTVINNLSGKRSQKENILSHNKQLMCCDRQLASWGKHFSKGNVHGRGRIF